MVQLKRLVKISLFLSSYFPLWLIFIISLLIDDKYLFFTNPFSGRLVDYYLITLLFIIIFSSSIVMYLIRRTKKENNPTPLTIKEKENSTIELALYSITYIIPFLTDNLLEYSKIFALGVLMFTIGLIYLRSNSFHLNPFLSFLNYKLYKISDTYGNKYTIFTKKEIKKHDKIRANRLAIQILIEAEDTNSIENENDVTVTS